MKATGIIRRIDDLGRIVIPLEIRRTMNIKYNDPLEIFVSNDGDIVFRKYSPIPNALDNLRNAKDILDTSNPFYDEVCSLISRMEKAER